jgi:hypothetical protein
LLQISLIQRLGLLVFATLNVDAIGVAKCEALEQSIYGVLDFKGFFGHVKELGGFFHFSSKGPTSSFKATLLRE